MQRFIVLFFSSLGFFMLLSPATASGRIEGSIQKTWDYPAEIRSVIVDVDRQDIVVKSGGPRTIGRLVGEPEDEAWTTSTCDTLTITVRSHPNWFSWGHRASRVELSVPPGTALDLSAASGAILVQVSTQGLKARSASGDIEASRGGSSVEADSTSGTVRLKGFTGPVQANTISGDLNLEALGGAIRVTSLSGSLEGKDLKPEDGSRFSTASGNAELDLTGGSGAYNLRTETVSGSVRLGETKAPSSQLSGAAGPSVTVKTVSGNIHIP